MLGWKRSDTHPGRFLVFIYDDDMWLFLLRSLKEHRSFWKVKTINIYTRQNITQELYSYTSNVGTKAFSCEMCKLLTLLGRYSQFIRLHRQVSSNLDSLI
jgi:hypothetical protein